MKKSHEKGEIFGELLIWRKVSLAFEAEIFVSLLGLGMRLVSVRRNCNI